MSSATGLISDVNRWLATYGSEEREWIRQVSVCEWFDKELLQYLPASRRDAARAWKFFERAKEIVCPAGTEKLRVHAVLQQIFRELPELHSSAEIGYLRKIWDAYNQMRQLLGGVDSTKLQTFIDLAHYKHFDVDRCFAEADPTFNSSVHSLLQLRYDVFERKRHTYSLVPGLKESLGVLLATRDDPHSAGLKQHVTSVWEQQQERYQTRCEDIMDELQLLRRDYDSHAAEIESLEAERSLRESERGELHDRRQALELFRQLHYTHKDALAAALSLIAAGLCYGSASAWTSLQSFLGYAPHDLPESLIRVLLSFSIAFGGLGVVFIVRYGVTAKRRGVERRQHTALIIIDASYTELTKSIEALQTQVSDLRSKQTEINRTTSLLEREMEVNREKLEEAYI
jgi:uncharacterized protein YlxW (UPF0749 family)